MKVRADAMALPKGTSACFLSLPAVMLNFRVLELPLAGMDKIREVLPFELEGLVLGEPGDYVIDCLSLGDKKVLAVCVEKAALRKLLDGFAAIGCEPRIVTAIDVGHAVRNTASVEELSRRLVEEAALNGDERPREAAAEIRQHTINLRRGEFSWRKEAERARGMFRYAALSLIAVFVFAAGDFLIRTLAVKKESIRLENAVFGTYSALFPGEKPQSAGDALLRMKAYLKEAKDKDALLTGLRPLETLLQLEQAAMPDIRVQDISFDSGLMMLKGEASSMGGVEQFRERLGRSEANISETGQSARGKVSFTITVKEKK